MRKISKIKIKARYIFYNSVLQDSWTSNHLHNLPKPYNISIEAFITEARERLINFRSTANLSNFSKVFDITSPFYFSLYPFQ